MNRETDDGYCRDRQRQTRGNKGGLDLVDTWSTKIHAVINSVDVNGNELLADKLYYSVWIEKDGEQQPFVFKSYDYWGIFEDTAEIPYSLDCWDITTGGETITFYEDEDVIKSWKRIGLQTIYYGGNERNVSNIVWAENPAYDGATGIASMTNDESQNGYRGQSVTSHF